MIPFVDLKTQYQSIKFEIDKAVTEVVTEASFIGGKHVSNFENNLKNKLGVKHVIPCANGTDSLYIIFKMLGIGPGDEVITPANSWISSSETITQTGATPVFCDVNSDNFCLNLNKLKNLINDRTKAVLAVHLYGHMCEMGDLMEICTNSRIFLVEDCAQSHFSKYNGAFAGTLGIAGSFSFYPGKNLGAYGDAGCIITNDYELAVKCRMFANHGALVKHNHEMEGINSRMDAIQAAVLNVKLKYIDSWTEQRIKNATLYCKYLNNIPQIQTPVIAKNCIHTFHLYVIKCNYRDELKEYLKGKGIETAIHYPRALPNLPAYKGKKVSADFYTAQLLEKQILSLPMYPELKESDIQYISSCIREFFKSI
jgi:dTDP-4-amino-4,6-dideoxygalactose transaminase